MIAMALLPEPKLIIADEPTTALDVTIQAQILNLLRQLVTQRNISVLFTTHDLGTTYEICDRVTVMYAGQEVETASNELFFANPGHPYTNRLLDSLPNEKHNIEGIAGEIPPMVNAPSGCRFHPRCNAATEKCAAERPEITDLGDNHIIRCFHPVEGSRQEADDPAVKDKFASGDKAPLSQPASSGRVVLDGNDISDLSMDDARSIRQHLQYAYQDPGASLDPRWKIRKSLHEPLQVHFDLSEKEREQQVLEIMKAVGLPEGHLDLYPHEISGGQQRRVGLARILTLRPSLIILDEPTSGLDVSVQATILNLLLDLRQQFNLTYLFISHDLSVVTMICDRVSVMYLGKVVEFGDTKTIFSSPKHPYTQSLLSATPKIGQERVIDTFKLDGEPPDPSRLPSGCRFRSRCPVAQPHCEKIEPELENLGPYQSVSCHVAHSDYSELSRQYLAISAWVANHTPS